MSWKHRIPSARAIKPVQASARAGARRSSRMNSHAPTTASEPTTPTATKAQRQS